eukprot:6002619-Pleurochrysis_carterae.AAC.1
MMTSADTDGGIRALLTANNYYGLAKAQASEREARHERWCVSASVCVCVCVRVRACVRACVRSCQSASRRAWARGRGWEERGGVRRVRDSERKSTIMHAHVDNHACACRQSCMRMAKSWARAHVWYVRLRAAFLSQDSTDGAEKRPTSFENSRRVRTSVCRLARGSSFVFSCARRNFLANASEASPSACSLFACSYACLCQRVCSLFMVAARCEHIHTHLLSSVRSSLPSSCLPPPAFPSRSLLAVPRLPPTFLSPIPI